MTYPAETNFLAYLVGLPLGAAISAFVLQLSCRFVNRVTSESIIVPKHEHAMKVMFFCGLADLGIQLAVSSLMNLSGVQLVDAWALVAYLLELSVSLLASAAIIRRMLSVSFSKALALCVVVVLIVAGASGVIAALVFIFLTAVPAR